MTQRSDAPAAGAPAAGAAGTAVYVYGVVDPGEAAAEPLPGGVAGDGSPARLVVHDGLAVVLSDVPANWRAATRADVEAHEGVLSALVERRTVIPMRFGMVLPSEEQARDVLLARHEPQLRELLRQLHGHVQVSVKAYYGEDALLRAVLAGHPELKRRSDALRDAPIETSQEERIALGRDVAHLVERQRELDERLLTEPLAATAADMRVEAPTSERMALNAQLLVARERRPEVDAAVERLGAAHGDRFAFRYVGPLAPYSFVDLALDVEEDTWG